MFYNMRNTYVLTDSALWEITYRELISSGYKFLDSHICLEKWVPFGQEYVPKGPYPPKKPAHNHDNPIKGSL